jgi:hypothetical protein
MNIKKAVDIIPAHKPKGRAAYKYGKIWDAVSTLKLGSWLPVECSTTKEAHRLAAAAGLHRHFKIKSAKRGLTVYLSRKS